MPRPASSVLCRLLVVLARAGGVAPRGALAPLALAAMVALAACGGGGAAPDDAGGDAACPPAGCLPADAPGDDAAPPPPCGNGLLDPGEQCDDLNPAAGDGCSDACQLELGWLCPTVAAPCIRQAFCGDGLVLAPETCDDGNSTPGDGCSGTCQLEPFFACDTPSPPPVPVHQVCASTIACGDALVQGAEACDSGETSGAMGCAADCLAVTPGWACPSAGGPCVLLPIPACGDAHLDPGEQCDDGGTAPGDGCDAACQVEPGYTCPAVGAPCTLVLFCGDGTLSLALAEQCDDGGAAAGDGCGPTCLLEPDFVCPTPGAPCVSTVVCGDGRLAGAETCDDGDLAAGDGCATSCQVEPGWTCPSPGAPCLAVACGDGLVAGSEACDLGPANGPASGCSAACKVNPGWACVANVCHPTTCGDGLAEGAEQCDDGGRVPFDGCSPSCTNEPRCAGGACSATCGDGLKFPSEACDDGNTSPGDGCSPACALEPGFACTNVDQAPPATISIPVLFHDMLYYGTTSPGPGHPDFQNLAEVAALRAGLVQATLGADGKPVWKSDQSSLSGAVNFCWWFHDRDCVAGMANPYARAVHLDTAGQPTTLTLTQISPNVYRYDAGGLYFPVDKLGWDTGPSPQENASCGTSAPLHNFSFTTEAHYAFTYKASAAPTLTFNGDDDVWVFINGRLAVDLGGLHGPTTGAITLDAATAAGLGLVDGGMYSIDLFQAERRVCGSNFVLTLAGFTRTVTQCAAVCGDGLVVAGEVCDDGVNDGRYGGCMPGCHARAPACGDHLVQAPPEQCDDGVNLATYGGAALACGPGCAFAPYCGDGVASNGEQCDDGPANGPGYGQCSAACTRGPFCGDGVVNGAERCDHGVRNGTTGDPCTASCTQTCGDGVLDPGEQCDDGLAANTGGYGRCSPSCTLGQRCGDGFKNGPEQCDNGVNSGAYGTCNPDCTLAPYCGDAVTSSPEQCDLGPANSPAAYGPGKCTAACMTAPFCGDAIVEPAFGEQCDGGPGCTATCGRIIN